ncbi:unnamed protein product [Polarella glacialis]|uniref:Uncharacterized protein n=1 Tax=Polarella glacialis TaxID=89957 RepID=A0A813LP66_POLGL|nr:unnamed protein product [Polarella glacialis]
MCSGVARTNKKGSQVFSHIDYNGLDEQKTHTQVFSYKLPNYRSAAGFKAAVASFGPPCKTAGLLPTRGLKLLIFKTKHGRSAAAILRKCQALTLRVHTCKKKKHQQHRQQQQQQQQQQQP